jgi:DNA-binding SARP family transcriptional activator
VSARKAEAVLVVLLIKSNQTVSIEQLVGEVWQGHPPRRATASIHVYVSQLRKLFTAAGLEAGRIVTRSPGYLLRVESGELDVHLFQERSARGRTLSRAGDYENAAAEFRSALGLWQWPVLGELGDSLLVSDYVAWLREVWLDCVESRLWADLELGRCREVISDLTTLIAEHPLHERFHEQLMLALHRAGRRADALRAYQSVRGIMRRELGLEPCQALQELQAQILREQPILAHEARVA